MDLNKAVFIFVILAKMGATSVRISTITFDKSNFHFIVNGGFEVKNYIDIDEGYHVGVPPGGAASGGAFIFDKKTDSCMTPIPVKVQTSVVLQTSFWCDPSSSKLRITTECNGNTERILCDGALTPGENGKWNKVTWNQYCAPKDSVSVIS